jgi:hypothetical protein
MNRRVKRIKGRDLENERQPNDCENNLQDSFACLIK